MLTFARELANQQHGALAALMLCCSLFERLESIDRGESSRDQSRQFFLDRAQKVFTVLDELSAAQLYNAARLGLYYEAVIRRGLELSHDAPDDLKIEPRPGTDDLLLVINPGKFVSTLEQHFQTWLEDVRPDPIRRAYIKSKLPSRHPPEPGLEMPQVRNISTRNE